MGKKIFISYKFTGENKKELEKEIKSICNSLGKKGHSSYCSFLDKNLEGKEKEDIFKSAMDEIDKSDTLFVFLKKEDSCEGMLMEIGYAMAKKKKIILAIKKDVKNTHLRELIEEVYEFDSLKDLEGVIEKL